MHRHLLDQHDLLRGDVLLLQDPFQLPQAGQRLEDISTIVERSAALAQRISQATQEQVSRVEQVGQVVEQMAEISLQSQGTVTKGRESAEKLQQLAAQLSDNLSRFRLA